MCTESGTGRTDGLKLYRPICSMPNQLAKSRALARAVDSPTIRNLRSVWDAMKLVRETIT